MTNHTELKAYLNIKNVLLLESTKIEQQEDVFLVYLNAYGENPNQTGHQRVDSSLVIFSLSTLLFTIALTQHCFNSS
jgi:hypothetical protein